MWCAQCQRHVAAIVGDGDGAALCASCGEPLNAFADLGGEAPPGKVPRPLISPTTSSPPSFAYSRARLEHIGRRLDALQRLTMDAPRLEPQHPPVGASRMTSGLALAKAVIFAGLASLTCGLVLSVWSLWKDDALLWRIGLPTAIVGQLLLVAALWRTGSPASTDVRGRATPNPRVNRLAPRRV